MKNKSIAFLTLSIVTCFFMISVISIYSANNLNNMSNSITKQTIFYFVGILMIFVIYKLNIKKVIKYSYIPYIFLNILLILVLFLGKEVNGSKCWFNVPGIGSFQPSEFMKISIILLNVKIFNWYDKRHKDKTLKDDIKLFFSIMIITTIPAFLTFIEPDTGMVIIYFLISFVMLFFYGIKKRIFVILFLLIVAILGSFLYTYFNYQDTFINIFGTSFFYRMDRLLSWSSNSGMQLINATSAIKAAGIFGFGIKHTPIYIPEAHTDFIFSVFANNTGFVGSMLLLLLIMLFDLCFILLLKKTNNKSFKYLLIGFLTMLFYQQIQNIGMNIGLLPITGITLPFISYGGSSLISYMLGLGLILSYLKEKNA